MAQEIVLQREKEIREQLETRLMEEKNKKRHHKLKYFEQQSCSEASLNSSEAEHSLPEAESGGCFFVYRYGLLDLCNNNQS